MNNFQLKSEFIELLSLLSIFGTSIAKIRQSLSTQVIEKKGKAIICWQLFVLFISYKIKILFENIISKKRISFVFFLWFQVVSRLENRSVFIPISAERQQRRSRKHQQNKVKSFWNFVSNEFMNFDLVKYWKIIERRGDNVRGSKEWKKEIKTSTGLYSS